MNNTNTNYKQTEIGEFPSSWSIGKLRDYVKVNPSRKLSKGTRATYVGMADIQPYERKISSFITKPYKGGARFINEDTLLARITPCLENGKTAYVDILDDEEIGFGSTEFIVLASKQDKTISKFIYYLARSPRLRHIAIRSMVGSSGRQRVQTDKLENTLFAFPEINEQKEIASILSSLDDKIELNRKMNKTLEEIGKSLFKHWFVDFEFPFDFAQGKPNKNGKPYKSSGGEMIESELGLIPKGWKVVPLKRIIDTRYGFTQSARGEPIGPKFLRVKDINKRSWIDWSEVPYCKINNKEFQKYKLHIGDILIARMADPGKLAIIEKDIGAVFASYLIRLKARKSSIFPYYLYYYLSSSVFQGIVLGASSGTTRKSINASQIRSLPFLRPDTFISSKFSDFVTPIREQITKNLEENFLLSQIRDSLLPRLISGKLRVN